MRSESDYCQVPLHFYPTVTLAQYQAFINDCPVCASVEEQEEFANTGAYITLDYYREDHKALMRYIKQNNGIVEIDMDTLTQMKD